MKSTPASQVGVALKKQMPSHLGFVHKFAVYLSPSLYYSLFANTTHPGIAILRFYNSAAAGQIPTNDISLQKKSFRYRF